MIEPIMFVAIGFLLAGLLVIGVIPLVHARAVRLTTRRLEALNPLSIAEIQADKDLLRAEFAMSTYRVEKRVEEIKAKATDHLTELGKKSEAIGRLKLELSEKTAALLALGAKEKRLAEDLESTQGELAVKAGALEEMERALASTEAELAEVPRSFVTADNKRSSLSRPKNSMRALLSVLEEQRDPSKDTQLEQISDDRAGRASRLRQFR
jgi:chromosome segregation ATPase